MKNWKNRETEKGATVKMDNFGRYTLSLNK